MALPIFPHLAKPVKLIVLDRDGVINEDSDEYVKSVDEWMFRTIAEHFGLADLKGVPVVGDSHRDLHAGMLLGGVPYLVRTGKGLRTLEGTLPPGTQVFDDLAAVVDHLLESSR